MAYIRTVPVEQAQGSIKEIYDKDLKASGVVQNYAQALSLRPDILLAYRGLSGAIRSHLDLRRYELITVAVAARLRCSY
ncbi:MAG TPA: hypothetical protein VFW08_04385 [bacterium]|nr:hypothetical protein [bacterium]